MNFQLQWLSPVQCFVVFDLPLATQNEVLLLRYWIGLLQNEWEDQLLEIQSEPRGILLFFSMKMAKKTTEKRLEKTWQKTIGQKEMRFQSWVFPLLWDHSDRGDLFQYFKGDPSQLQAYQEQFVAQPLYAAFYGFMPGFVYMGGLPPAMRLARKDEPRLQVPAGSVAVGERYVGIYPQVSPGGWQLIGQTPIALFDRNRSPAFFLAPGDRILWKSVSASEMKYWQQQYNNLPQSSDDAILL